MSCGLVSRKSCILFPTYTFDRILLTALSRNRTFPRGFKDKIATLIFNIHSDLSSIISRPYQFLWFLSQSFPQVRSAQLEKGGKLFGDRGGASRELAEDFMKTKVLISLFRKIYKK
jgi:hypothetical protein